MESIRTKELKKILQSKGVISNVKESIEKGINVSPEDIASIFKENSAFGRVVPTCSRPLPCVNLGKVSNLNSFGEDEKKYFDVGSSDLKIYAFPEIQRQIGSIFSSIWSQTKKMQACRSELMSKKTFINEYMAFLDRKQKALDELKSLIEANYEFEMGYPKVGIKGRFELMVEQALGKVSTNLEAEVRSHIRQITSVPVTSFVEQFRISLFTDFSEDDFTSAPQNIIDLLTEFKKNHVINSGMNIVRGLLQESWTALTCYLSSMEKNVLDDDLTVSSFGRMRTTFNGRADKILEEIKAMEEAGINSPYMTLIASLIGDLRKVDLKYDAEEVILETMSLIKKEAEKVDLDLNYPKDEEVSWVTAEKLEEVYKDFIEAFA